MKLDTGVIIAFLRLILVPLTVLVYIDITRSVTTKAYVVRMSGRQGGRPRLLDDEQHALALRLHQERPHPIADSCRIKGIFKSTLYSYLDEAQRHAGAQG